MALRDSHSRSAQEFAARLLELKVRSDRTFEALSLRVGVSRSALHRYCSGRGVPADYAVVERLGRLCRADERELSELHRLWVLADAARRRDSQRADRPHPPVRHLAAVPPPDTPVSATPPAGRPEWLRPALGWALAATAAGALTAWSSRATRREQALHRALLQEALRAAKGPTALAA
ncbi:helix-turn-helix domain-containing protein [Streptomyces sp. MAR4 CNX-425]|uniref:helix-turn-helix domain-containing protein n=1 Tax=Streptomyces sp. MAR4 CNX-425 TaxID=3406343 RepID=UPI003B50F43E